jgi:hypothetical protein
MSDNIQYTLSEQTYNAIYGIASTISGEKSKVAASKLIEIIKEEVTKNAKGEELPESITVDVPRKVLDGFYIGITEKIKDEKITTNDVMLMREVCTLLKMRGRIDNFIKAELESIPDNDEAFDDEIVEIPLDGE